MRFIEDGDYDDDDIEDCGDDYPMVDSTSMVNKVDGAKKNVFSDLLLDKHGGAHLRNDAAELDTIEDNIADDAEDKSRGRNTSTLTMMTRISPIDESEPAPAPAHKSVPPKPSLQDSLDLENTELLNRFLSKAKEKRAANAAALESEPQAGKTSGEKVKKELVAEFPTPPPSRRALEQIDANSPSQLHAEASPSKDGMKRRGRKKKVQRQNQEKETGMKEAEQQSSNCDSPTVRRSGRARTTRGTTTPSLTVRNTATIPLRRPKGTEVVAFQQRTESQELTLITRNNTKQNKGNAVLPKEALKILASRHVQNMDERGDNAGISPDLEYKHMQINDDQTGSRKQAGRKANKHVSWKKRRLVMYEGEEYDDEEGESEKEEEEKEKENKPDISIKSFGFSGKGSDINKNKTSTRPKKTTTTSRLTLTPTSQHTQRLRKTNPNKNDNNNNNNNNNKNVSETGIKAPPKPQVNIKAKTKVNDKTSMTGNKPNSNITHDKCKRQLVTFPRLSRTGTGTGTGIRP